MNPIEGLAVDVWYRLLNIMRGDRLIKAMLVAYTEVFPDPSVFPKNLIMSPIQLYKFCTFHTLLQTQVAPYIHDPAKGRSLVMQLKAVQVPSETQKSKQNPSISTVCMWSSVYVPAHLSTYLSTPLGIL